jgi:hypothetical protein
MSKNLARISKTESDPRVPLAVSTLYKWHHVRKFPKLFVKLGGALFIDLDELDLVIERGRQK